MTSTTVSIDRLFKDLYPRAGDRIKQWVVDQRREREWEAATCPRVAVQDHKDNCGADCRNALIGSALWVDLGHDSCSDCNELQDATATRDDVVAWLADKAKRPPITTDRDALSDEIAGR